MFEIQIRDQIVAACKRLYNRNMLAAADGNVSFRLDDERILITPSGVAKAFMKPTDIAVIDIEGEIVDGKPSAERLMHLEVYRKCSQARAVVHAHPPHAIAWSVQDPRIDELPSDILSEVILAAGRVPVVPYARPTTADLGRQIGPFLPQCRLMILERHGGLAWGEDLDEAVNGMERLEHSAQILWLAQILGRPRSLPPEEVAELQAMRESLGDRLT